MNTQDPLDAIYSVTIEPVSGCTVDDAAIAAYELRRVLGCSGPVYFVHNGRRYRSDLQIIQEPKVDS